MEVNRQFLTRDSIVVFGFERLTNLAEGRFCRLIMCSALRTARADTRRVDVILPFDFEDMMRSAFVSKSASDRSWPESFREHLIGLAS